MERPYDDATHNDVTYFTGKEVEKTPAFGLKTLFVVGVQPVEEILAEADVRSIEHIYLGANQSYKDPNCDDFHKMVNELLESTDMYVTCDIPHEFLTTEPDYMDWVCGWCESNNFIPMISVKMPYVGLFNYNTTVKIDDTDFNDTNPGVWCHSLHDLKTRDAFTPWSKYTKDEVVK